MDILMHGRWDQLTLVRHCVAIKSPDIASASRELWVGLFCCSLFLFTGLCAIEHRWYILVICKKQNMSTITKLKPAKGAFPTSAGPSPVTVVSAYIVPHSESSSLITVDSAWQRICLADPHWFPLSNVVLHHGIKTLSFNHLSCNYPGKYQSWEGTYSWRCL